ESHQRHRSWVYTWIPLGSYFVHYVVWTMLITWIATGRLQYDTYISMSPNQHVPFISDIAADVLKPLFITSCSITTASFVLSLILDRYFRHSDGLYMCSQLRRRRYLSENSPAFLSSVIGCAGLILLLIFDVRRHKPFHDSFLLMFTAGVAVSAICTRHIDFPHTSQLKRSFWMKSIVAGILITFAIVFAATESKIVNVGCVFEWAVSMGFSFHLLKFYHNLRPENSLNSRDVEGVHKGEFSMMDHLDRTADNETPTLGDVIMSRVVSRGDQGFYQLAVVVCFQNPDSVRLEV
ncbi:Frag1/DRAM/Sfk1 family-domain-containing protein, partial [Lentinula raphanica]